MDPRFGGAFTDFEVSGVVRDVRFDNPTRIDPTHVYLPSGGPGSRRVALVHHSTLEVLVRFQGNRKSALSAVETTMGAFDKNLLPSLRLINVEDDDARPQRAMSELLATVATILAVLAASLAGIGIYGVIAYLVSQRTREIGIRIALGANSGAVLKNVILQGLRPVFAGLILGLAAAAGLSSVLHWALFLPGAWDLLYGVPFYDPVTFAGMICFVMGIAALASAVPARRALTVDPITALRYE
jgi:ABC-type antimicrobial peptide transport system permease subunit